MQIKLYYLACLNPAFIFHLHICNAVIDPKILYAAFSIGKTETERIQRISLIISVGPAPHRVVREVRHFFQCSVAVECHRQFPGRRFLSEKEIGEKAFYERIRNLLREEIDTLTNDADLIGKRYERFRKIGADAVMKESV